MEIIRDGSCFLRQLEKCQSNYCGLTISLFDITLMMADIVFCPLNPLVSRNEGERQRSSGRCFVRRQGHGKISSRSVDFWRGKWYYTFIMPVCRLCLLGSRRQYIAGTHEPRRATYHMGADVKREGKYEQRWNERKNRTK